MYLIIIHVDLQMIFMKSSQGLKSRIKKKQFWRFFKSMISWYQKALQNDAGTI